MFTNVFYFYQCVLFGCVIGSGIFHDSSKITFYPDQVKSDYFGYSVLLTRFGLIVGAPKATHRVGAVTSGLVFNCTLGHLESKNVTCSYIDQNTRFRRFFMNSFFKDDMWFGATLGALTDSKLLICAPRYMEPYNKDKHLLAYGACYIHKNYRDETVFPLRDTNRLAVKVNGKRTEYREYGLTLNYFAYGQVGMSMKVTGDQHVILGAPGLLQWAGGIVSYIYSPDDFNSTFKVQAIPNPYYILDLGPDDYFGYSVDSGIFVINGSILHIGGAPRSKMGYGQVLVFEPATRDQEAIHILAKLQGPQLGSYFGATLCALDIDGDGAADLLVGAPNYVMKNSGLPYDQGAVFVYMSKQVNASFVLEAAGSVSGSGESGARFGTSIADLGDVDGDGFRDVAVGAPWENEGSGVVYIYRGFSKGLRSRYNQRILAEGAGGFGISISKGIDVDKNYCNDLAIGAATSATAYLYRCIPTVRVHTSIKVPDAMNLPHNATGFTALFCVTLPPKPSWKYVKIDFKAKITIDPEENRAMISGDSEYMVTASPGDERCDEQTVEVKPTADLSKPILIKFELEPDEMLKNDTIEFHYKAARVSEDSQLETTFLIQLVRDCGEDMICMPWLVMTLDPLENPYIPGASTKLGARLTILNKEEPAYGASVTIILPTIPKRIPSSCILESALFILVLVCDVPAPLLRDEDVVWDIELEYNEDLLSNMKQLKISAELNDTLYYRNITKDSYIELLLNLKPEANFNITGEPFPNATVAVSRDKLYAGENITFLNYLEITNNGPSDWYSLEVQILLDVVEIASPIEGCVDEETRVVCIWPVRANVTKEILLPLQFDLKQYGDILERNTTVNATTSVFLFWKDNHADEEFFTNTTIITTLVLDPAPPIWPLVVGIVVGLVCGLLLLGLIIYLLHKYGFFSRNQHQRLKELQEGEEPIYDELEETLGAPSTAGATGSVSNESTKELLFEDSD